MSKALKALKIIKNERVDLDIKSKNDTIGELFSEECRVIEKELKDYEKIKDIDTKSITINDFFDSDIKMIQGLFQIAQNKILEGIKSNETITKGRLAELLCFGSRIALDVAKGYDFSKRNYNTHHQKELKALEIIKDKKLIDLSVDKNEEKNEKYYFIEILKDKYDLLKEVLKNE